MTPYPPSYTAATAHRAPPRPPLGGDTDCAIAVIGGGYTGLSAALALAEAGHNVRLIEANKVGWGASGRNGGQAIAGLRHGPAQLIKRFGRDHARDLTAIASAARAHFWALIARHAIACDPRRGHLQAAAKPGDVAYLAADAAAHRALTGQTHLEMLGAAEVAAALGTRIYHGGLFDPLAGHVHPLNLALGLARAAEAAGAVLHEGTRASAIDGNHIVTPHGRLRAQHIVLACDAASGALVPALAGRVLTVGNYAIATEPLGDAGVLPADWAVADTRFVLDYYRRSADGRLLFAGGEKYLPTLPADIAAFVRPHMLRVFPQLADARIDYGWGGAVTITRSRFAAVGRVPFGAGGQLLYAHGYSGQGLMLGCFMGTLMARAVAGQSDDFDRLAALPTGRFPGGRALRTPLHVAGMLWYALRDRL